MPIQLTYTQARENLAKIWDDVTQNRETVIITRRGAENVALISAEELASLEETAYLLRSPKNAERLLSGITRSRSGDGRVQTVDDLRREVGLDEENG